ncbi:hypothetical protein [Larkinella sp.]|uniref:hypothetical protein n=1 Tax=Larkinella sp. TaxID=2034517 RepID=UPI003BAC23A9
MHHVQHFKANFDHSDSEAATDTPTGYAANGAEFHDTDSTVRNVSFVWPDGRKAFFNYAYLVAVDLVLSDNLNVMLLYFSGQIVTLKGYHLGLLFDLLLNHIPKTITAIDPRYRVDGQTTEDCLVIEIMVKNE